ncbi:MAG: COX15/CtaA family protein [Rhodovibrionaceae bacterium]
MHRRSAPAIETEAPHALAAWVLLCAAMVFAMAVIGAITRLTESGLSIMEWAPVTGALPPLSQGEWERLFALYRQIPEYRLENAGMTLTEFKTIFWWEWIHRFWGRLIGVVFLLPFLWFLWRRQVPQDLKLHLAAVFLLGALQGALGWFMVASGFSERSDVSQYRLAAHLALALIIYGYLFWLWLRLTVMPEPSEHAGRLRGPLWGLLALLAVTLLSGALVAGTNAGLTYNSFPLMDGRLIPKGYAQLEPFLMNWFENIAAVQFNHRLLATLTVTAALAVSVIGLNRDPPAAPRLGLILLAAAALAQWLLGISALLLAVPVWLGAAHQAGAILLLTATLNCLYRLRAA